MFPAANSQQRLSASKPGDKPSKKVPLKPGRSLVDWVRLKQSGRDLKGTGHRLLSIPEEELALHNKPNDIWLAIRGMVYNVTAYMEYHPGGVDELMRGAGKDATALFEEVHRWVNYESMLKECLVGKLVAGEKHTQSSTSKGMLAPPQISASSLNPIGINTLKVDEKQASNVPIIKIEDASPQPLPHDKQATSLSHDWYQSGQSIVFVLYCKSSELAKHQFMCYVTDKTLFIDVNFGGLLHSFEISLYDSVASELNLTLTKFGKAQVTLKKLDPSIRWQTLGSVQYSKSEFYKQNFSRVRFCDCTIVKKSPLTHDTSLYQIRLPKSCWMQVPIGYHVYVRMSIEGIEISRPYTPVHPCPSDHAISQSDQDLFLAIKHYDNGNLTSILKTREINDTVVLSTYDGNFDFGECLKFKTCIMLAAGTGITPMVKVMCSLLCDGDEGSVHLIFFNKRQMDIIWQNEFEVLRGKYSSRFFVENVLSQADNSWTGKRGRISYELIETYAHDIIPDHKKDEVYFLMCGPIEFTKQATAIIKKLGFLNSHAFT